MISSLKTSILFLSGMLVRRITFRDWAAIDSRESACHFVSTRAAFVAQKTLYGYLKTRMGIRYPTVFQDDVFLASINIAKLHVYAACLSDLAVFAAARALRDEPLDDAQRRDLALRCFRQGLDDNAAAFQQIESFAVADALRAFQQRLTQVDWHAGPQGRELFSLSPAALYHWAPIAPELKQADREIVINSITFTWRDLRLQFEKRLNGPALAADLVRQAALTDAQPVR